jgi:outer membrane protein assembly factor BamB
MRALSVTLFFATVTHAQDTDWRSFRGNDGTATVSAKLPTRWTSKENVVWKTDLPGAGTSTPVVIGDHVFVTCYSGYNVPGQGQGKQEDLKLHLCRLDRKTGKLAWTKDVKAKLPEQEKIRDGHGYASSTPTAGADRVYCFFGKSGVVAFDHDGKELWTADVGATLHGWGSAASLLLHDGLLIVNASVESETLFALDVKTGKEVWNVKKVFESWNTPVLAKAGDRTELVLAINGKVLGLDPKSGKELWRCDTGIPAYMVPSVVVADGVAYVIGGRPAGGLAVKLGGSGDVTKTHRLWTSKKGSIVSSPVYSDGHLYWMGDNNETAFCAVAKTGEVVYEEKVPRAGQVYGSPVLADGKIYYPARDGKVHVVAAAPKFELIASNTFGERGTFNSSPAVSGSRLLLRTDKAVYCVGAE